MSLASKVNILTQEGSRRLRKCSQGIPWDVKKEYLDKLSIQMMWASYSERTRELVVIRVLARDSNNQWNYTNLGRPLYRDRDSRKVNIKLDKAT